MIDFNLVSPETQPPPDLAILTPYQVRQIARDRGIDDGGTKLDVLTRLGFVTHENAPPAEDVWPEIVNLVHLSKTVPEQPKFNMRDWLPCGYATLFAGHGGIGKSGIALMLAVCLAMGIFFFGLPVERRRVLYLSCEDREGLLHWRLERICAYLGISLADLAGWLNLVDLVGYDTILYQPSNGHTNAYQALSNRFRDTGSQLLFVDGIADTYGGNENSRAEVKGYVNALLGLIPPDTGSVVLIGHVSKPSANTKTAEGYSGSTGWHNSVRARWYLYPESKIIDDYHAPESTGKLLLELQKSNLGPSGESMAFEWNPDHHLFLGTLNRGESNFDRNARDDSERDGILSAIRNSVDYIPAAATGNRTGFHVLSVSPDFPKSLIGKPNSKRFWRHIETLRRMGLVVESSIRRVNGHKTAILTASVKAFVESSNAEKQ